MSGRRSRILEIRTRRHGYRGYKHRIALNRRLCKSVRDGMLGGGLFRISSMEDSHIALPTVGIFFQPIFCLQNDGPSGRHCRMVKVEVRGLEGKPAEDGRDVINLPKE
jgi:hypothetical protein